MESTKKHGGQRPGAGRRSVNRKTVQVRLAPDVIDILKDYPYRRSDIINEAIRLYKETGNILRYKDMKANNYTVVASCDAYNAKFHNVGGIAIATHNGTATEWTFANWQGLTLEEAREVLADLAADASDNVHYEDDETIKAMKEEAAKYGDEVDVDWYCGPGYYDSSTDERIFDTVDGMSFRYDTMSYRIE